MVGLKLTKVVDEGELFSGTSLVVSSRVVSELVGLETEVSIVGVMLEEMKVGLVVNSSGCKVVRMSEIVGLTTEVMIVGLELTIIVDEGGLV